MNITEKAMLVRLSISQWTARRFDQKATSKVISDYGAKRDAGRFNKLLVDNVAVKRYQKAANEARTFHYENTLPWGDDDARILPADNFMTYTQKMRELKAQFDKAVEEFIEEYPALIEKAQKDLNGLFQASDYPSAYELRYKFRFQTHVTPVPAANDFRVTLSNEDVDRIKTDIESRAKESIVNAMDDIWKRLFEAVRHMAVKLNEPDAIFRDSLIGNIADLCDILPRLNLTDDPNLAQIIHEAKHALAALDPNDLRKKDTERKKATAKANEVLKKMESYMGE